MPDHSTDQPALKTSPRFNGLYTRIAAIYLVLMLLLCGISAVVFVRNFTHYTDEVEQRLNLSLASEVAKQLEPTLRNMPDGPAAQQFAQRAKLLNPSLELYVLNSEGRILANLSADTTGQPEPLRLKKLETKPLKALLARSEALPIYGQNPLDSSALKVFSVATTPLANNRTGYVYIILRGMPHDEATARLGDSYILRTIGTTLLIVIVSTAVLGLLLFALLTRRLRRLTRTVEQFGDGNYDERVAVTRNDEIGRLADSFNKMADMIANQMRALQQVDKDRRNLVGNLSHDFRSPLTSTRAMAERLLKRQSELEQGEQRALLAGIIDSADRLQAIADQFNDLTLLDIRRQTPEHEPFNMAELLQDMAIHWRTNADSQGIKLELEFSNDLPQVLGDIGLIERALSNLFDNAIQHCDSGDSIHVSVNRDDQQSVTVTVRDTGCGIPTEELPKVQRRFHRGQHSKKRRSEGSGLGLAIVSEIAELHGEALQLQSKVGIGTRVQLTLPIQSPPIKDVAPS